MRDAHVYIRLLTISMAIFRGCSITIRYLARQQHRRPATVTEGLGARRRSSTVQYLTFYSSLTTVFCFIRKCSRRSVFTNFRKSHIFGLLMDGSDLNFFRDEESIEELGALS